MTRLIAKLKTARNAYKLEVKDKLALAYAERQLAKGERLSGGDFATGDDGHVYEIVARPEKLLHIDCPAPREAAIVGYVLGNGHVPAQIGKGFVRIVHVPELEQVRRVFQQPPGGPARRMHHAQDPLVVGERGRVAGLPPPRVRPRGLVEVLTAREHEVLRLVADGRSNAEIARRLFVEQSTVKTHLVHVYRKLEVRSRTQAVARAREFGLLT